jgi:hypothetical protein
MASWRPDVTVFQAVVAEQIEKGERLDTAN